MGVRPKVWSLGLEKAHKSFLPPSCHSTMSSIEWIMFHGHLNYFQKPHLGGRPNTKPGETIALRMFITVDLFYFIMCEDSHE